MVEIIRLVNSPNNNCFLQLAYKHYWVNSNEMLCPMKFGSEFHVMKFPTKAHQ